MNRRGWSRYVALGDSLSAGDGDEGTDWRKVGWARRMSWILSARTGTQCNMLDLATGGATVDEMWVNQLEPALRRAPDLVSVTVGINGVGEREWDPEWFRRALDCQIQQLAGTGATLLLCTYPDMSERAFPPMPAEASEEAVMTREFIVAILRERMWEMNNTIRKAAGDYDAFLLDMWAQEAPTDDMFCEDGLHPSTEGALRIAHLSANLLLGGEWS